MVSTKDIAICISWRSQNFLVTTKWYFKLKIFLEYALAIFECIGLFLPSDYQARAHSKNTIL